MTPIEIITLTFGVLFIIALFLHQKALNEDYNCYCLTGKHLYDQDKLKERGNTLFWVAVCNFLLALFNLFYVFFK